MAIWESGIDELKAAYAEWDRSKGDKLTPWLDLLAAEVDFRSLANGREIPWTATCCGVDDVHSYLKNLTSMFKMVYSKVDQYVCQDDTVVAIGTTAWTHIGTGKKTETPKVDIWRFNKEGKAVSFFELYDTAGIIEATQA